MHELIVIIGFMGSGKTTVAQSLARQLNWSCTDLDEEITNRQGIGPKQIIETTGENAFRNIETEILKEVLADRRPRVIAAGGGAWTVEANRRLIQEQNAVTVWLDAPFELCWMRIESCGQTRPLARSEQQARELFTERFEVYRSADLPIAVSIADDPAEIANRIVRLIPVNPTR
jgi:shikimate kinase